MHSLIPLSLFLTVLDAVHAIDFTVHTSNTPPPNRLGRRAIPVSNNGNAAYIADLTLAGVNVSVILDTGSSDLWVKFPDAAPSTTDTGKSLSLDYAVGSASGDIRTAEAVFDGFTVENQAFLQVANSSSFTSGSAFDGLIGLGPSEGSVINSKLDNGAGDTLLDRIFQQDKLTSNYITFLLNRNKDLGQNLTGQFTIGTPVPGYENITSQPQLNVETVHALLDDQQHWQAITDKNNGVIGPDGNPISISSIVPKAPDGTYVSVFDSGFTFSQVPRDMSDAIYGRVQGALYDTKNEWWTVPCGQLINLTFHFGGVAIPIHPLDVVDNNFPATTDVNGNPACIGAFQPITSAFSLFGNFDMIMGMTFLRNVYTLMDFGDWVDNASNDRGDPFIQLLPLTDPVAAHADFVNVRLNGVDTTGSSQYALLPASQQQHSPVSAEEKKKKYEEMILSRWPYILVGCLVGVILIIGLIVWRCCCRRKGKQSRNKGMFEQKSQTYLPLQVQQTPQPTPQQPQFDQHYGGQQEYTAQQGYGQHEYGGGYGGQTGYGGQKGYGGYSG
ncbi:aspartic peptidase A1 [Mycena sanguinolenta]|nr:aspartic peptidase A1 [Mycena sanguinolenta]